MRRLSSPITGLMVIMALLLSACSADLLSGDDTATPTIQAAAAATPTHVEPLRIVTPTPFSAGATTTAEQTPTIRVANPDVYVVQANETLYGIAVRFDVELNELISVNGLSDPNDIRIGQELEIPQK